MSNDEVAVLVSIGSVIAATGILAGSFLGLTLPSMKLNHFILYTSPPWALSLGMGLVSLVIGGVGLQNEYGRVLSMAIYAVVGGFGIYALCMSLGLATSWAGNQIFLARSISSPDTAATTEPEKLIEVAPATVEIEEQIPAPQTPLPLQLE